VARRGEESRPRRDRGALTDAAKLSIVAPVGRPRALTGIRLVALVAVALGMGVLGFFTARGCGDHANDATAPSDPPLAPGSPPP
jgi:hypothetical protein